MENWLVANWRDGWRWWSARLLAVATLWETLMFSLEAFAPQEKAALLDMVGVWLHLSQSQVTSMLVVAALVARFIKQSIPDPHPPVLPSQPLQ